MWGSQPQVAYHDKEREEKREKEKKETAGFKKVAHRS